MYRYLSITSLPRGIKNPNKRYFKSSAKKSSKINIKILGLSVDKQAAKMENTRLLSLDQSFRSFTKFQIMAR